MHILHNKTVIVLPEAASLAAKIYRECSPAGSQALTVDKVKALRAALSKATIANPAAR